MRHVVWDWNGTLYDDLHIVVGAVNASLAELGERPIDDEAYRDHYTRPVRRFYEALLDRPVSSDEFVLIDRVFHETYGASLDQAGLAVDAETAVSRVSAASTQSLLSMWRHDSLVDYVGRLGLASYMTRIDGNRSTADASKAGAMEEHVTMLIADGTITDRTPVLVIGDGLDDARSAAAAGVDCVLYAGGTHHRRELERAGVPVADTLTQALQLGNVL
jgi:phosphoglycolate phosphatase-like HAD superfamily hydrolase